METNYTFAWVCKHATPSVPELFLALADKLQIRSTQLIPAFQNKNPGPFIFVVEY